LKLCGEAKQLSDERGLRDGIVLCYPSHSALPNHVVRRRSGPLEMLAGFTWSKVLDDSSGWGQQINPVNYT
jgi:hypothetical protein